MYITSTKRPRSQRIHGQLSKLLYTNQLLFHPRRPHISPHRKTTPTMLHPRSRRLMLSGRYKTSSSAGRQGRLFKMPVHNGAGIVVGSEEGRTISPRDGARRTTGQSTAMTFQTARHGSSSRPNLGGVLFGTRRRTRASGSSRHM